MLTDLPTQVRSRIEHILISWTSRGMLSCGICRWRVMMVCCAKVFKRPVVNDLYDDADRH